MKFIELRLGTQSLARQRKFYTETLGLRVLEETPKSFTVNAGLTALHFSAAEEFRPYHFAFNIPENKLTEAKVWLLERVQLLEEDGQNQFSSESWNAEQVYFFDAAGNILEFIARHELPNASSDPFSSAHILNISEIGYVVPSVPKTVSSLDKLGLEPYREPGEKFAAVGDAHGLLIVAEMNRPWVPTAGQSHEVRASAATLELTLRSSQTFDYTEPGLPYHLHGVPENH